VAITDRKTVTVLRCTGVVDYPSDFHSTVFIFPPERETAKLLIGGKRLDLSDGVTSVVPINFDQYACADRVAETVPYFLVAVEPSYLDMVENDLFGFAGLEFENRGFPVSDELRYDVGRFIAESKLDGNDGDFIMDSLAALIVVDLIRTATKNVDRMMRVNRRHPGIGRAVELIRRSYNANLSVGDLASEASLSPTHFIAVFKRDTGMTPHEFLRCVRIECAMRLLRSGKKDVTSTCFASGFQSLSGFEAAFSALVGMTPMNYLSASREG